LFALSPVVTRKLANVDHSHPARKWSLHVGIFLVAVYGGYFGAGFGILLLAVMTLALPLQIHELQGLRNAVSMIINTCAAVVFLIHGDLAVQAVLMLLIGMFIGGWLGALLILRLSPTFVRVLVIVAGVVTTVKLATS
jgi:uncharacterized membrane protein YfcA